MRHSRKILTLVALSVLVLVRWAAAATSDPDTATAVAPAATPAPKNVVLIGDSNTWYHERPMAAHRVMEHMLADIPFLDKEWLGAKVHNLAISGTNPHHWIVEKKCIEGGKGNRYPINSHCDEIDFLAEGITKVVPKPDVVIVNLGLNASGRFTPEETVDQLVQLREYLSGIAPRVILAAPLPMPPGRHRAFVAAVRQEMLDRGVLDWDFPQMEFLGNNTKVHLTERARARHGALMAIWLVYGRPELAQAEPDSGTTLQEFLNRQPAKKRKKQKKARSKPRPKASSSPEAALESR